jgi:hypothetical protein
MVVEGGPNGAPGALLSKGSTQDGDPFEMDMEGKLSKVSTMNHELNNSSIMLGVVADNQ